LLLYSTFFRKSRQILPEKQPNPVKLLTEPASLRTGPENPLRIRNPKKTDAAKRIGKTGI
jgi:hypothetical protein